MSIHAYIMRRQADPTPTLTPWEHQRLAHAHIEQHPQSALYYFCATGKSYIIRMSMRTTLVDRKGCVVVVVPSLALVKQFIDQSAAQLTPEGVRMLCVS